METFTELRAAVADWLAIARPDAPWASLLITVELFESRHARLEFAPAETPPTDATAARGRVLAAMAAFVADMYPEAEGCSLWVTGSGRPKSSLTIRGKVGTDQEIVESHEAPDFRTTDSWPVGQDGKRGLRRIVRKDPADARNLRRMARICERRRVNAGTTVTFDGKEYPWEIWHAAERLRRREERREERKEGEDQPEE